MRNDGLAGTLVPRGRFAYPIQRSRSRSLSDINQSVVVVTDYPVITSPHIRSGHDPLNLWDDVQNKRPAITPSMAGPELSAEIPTENVRSNGAPLTSAHPKDVPSISLPDANNVEIGVGVLAASDSVSRYS